MNDNVNKRLDQIKIENYIWIIYLVIIGLSYYSNYLEKDYFLNQNLISKEKYRKINLLIFTTLTIIYAYFEKEAIEEFKNKNKTKSQEQFDFLALIGSTAVLISGLIFLYIIINDENLDEEIAFN